MSGGAWVIIPARGGSKGVPRKNVALLGGRPLIEYTIEAALKAESVSRVLVSTEDAEIAEIARKAGAEVPFLRPRKLAGDTALVGRAIEDMLQRLRPLYGTPEVRVSLFPSSPFRRPELIDQAVAGTRRFGRMVSVRRVHCPADRYLLGNGQGTFLSAAPGALPFEALLMTGTVMAVRPDWKGTLEETKLLFINETDAVDIDRPEDLLRAEKILRSGRIPAAATTGKVVRAHPHPVILSRFVEAGGPVIRVKAWREKELWKQRWFLSEGGRALPLLGGRETGEEISLEREAGRWVARCPGADETEVITGEEGEGVISFSPMEMAGLWKINPARPKEKTNLLSGERITGRQQYPPLFTAPETTGRHASFRPLPGKATG